jgi:RNA-binding protein
MRTLTSAERRTLRATAHHLQPVVSIGDNGLTPSVLHELDVNLNAHELIKVRVFEDDRDERDSMLAQICTDLNSAPVQHIGKTFILWRPSADPEAPGLQVKGRTGDGSRSRRRANAARQKQSIGNPRRRLGSARRSGH